jgi:transcriptional pleiotropic regulator of transition state genes
MSGLKATGIVRKIDSLGRIVIPIELRKTLNADKGTSFEIYSSKDKIVLKKYAPGCHFCGNMEDLVDYEGDQICQDCISKLDSLTGVQESEDHEGHDHKESEESEETNETQDATGDRELETSNK